MVFYSRCHVHPVEVPASCGPIQHNEPQCGVNGEKPAYIIEDWLPDLIICTPFPYTNLDYIPECDMVPGKVCYSIMVREPVIDCEQLIHDLPEMVLRVAVILAVPE